MDEKSFKELCFVIAMFFCMTTINTCFILILNYQIRALDRSTSDAHKRIMKFVLEERGQ